MSDTKHCPNCKLENSGHNTDAYWKTINAYKRLAIKSGAITDLVDLAMLELSHIATGVSSSAQPEGHLCYPDHYKHVREAARLLARIEEIRRGTK